MIGIVRFVRDYSVIVVVENYKGVFTIYTVAL